MATQKTKTNLFLVLKKEFFNQILEGSKTSEYRIYSEHWQKIIADHKFETVTFQLGYKNQNRITKKVTNIEIIKKELKTYNYVETEVYKIDFK
jgi:hypothetical protein